MQPIFYSLLILLNSEHECDSKSQCYCMFHFILLFLQIVSDYTLEILTALLDKLRCENMIMGKTSKVVVCGTKKCGKTSILEQLIYEKLGVSITA